MAWNTPSQRNTNELITASIWNTDVVNNLLYLAWRPRTAAVQTRSDYTTTSASWVTVDGSTLSRTLTFTNGRALIGLYGSLYVSTSAQRVNLRVTRNGVDLSGGAAYGLLSSSDNLDTPFALIFLVEGPLSGSHTFTLQWYVTGGATGRLRLANVASSFFVAEI